MDDLLLYAAAIGIDATASPSAVAGVGAVPSATATGAATATPSAVAGVGAVPAASASGNPHYVQDVTTLNTTSGNKSATITPAVGALLVVVAYTTNNVTDPTITDDQSGTYTKLGSCVRGGSTHGLWIYARDSLVSSAVAHVVTMTESTNNGGGLDVQEWYNYHRVGAAAAYQTAKQDNRANAGGETPTVTFSNSARTQDGIIAAIQAQATTPNISEPSGFTERRDTGYSSPNAGWEIATIDQGQTGTSLSWGAAVTAGVGFADLVVELNADPAAPATVAGIGDVPAATASSSNAIGFPAATAGVGAVPAPTVTGAATALPDAVAGVGFVQTPASVTGVALTTPSVVAGVSTVPSPTVFSAATAVPVTVAGIGAVPAPAADGGGGNAFGLPTVTSGIGAVPDPTAIGGFSATVTPSAVAGVGAVPAPTAFAVSSPTITPDTVEGVGAVPHAEAVGVGTGGGGGSVDGVTDYWVLKGLG